MSPNLSEICFRERRLILANRSDSPLRLMGTIITALLAITMAIFPISMPRAAASTGHAHAAATAPHAHKVHDAKPHADHHHAVQASAICDDATAGAGCEHHPKSSYDQGDPTCCGGMGCHSFQVSTAPIVSSPAVAPIPLAVAGDEQVAGLVIGRLDRPPRTI